MSVSFRLPILSPREGSVGRKGTGARKSLEALFCAASDTFMSLDSGHPDHIS